MILHSIRVKYWRSFLEETLVGPFSEGLNVVHAPNGTGKSSLFEALRLGLLDKHRTGGTEVGALVPWGRPLAPWVSIEFLQDGTQYRMTKQFLTAPSAQLERMEDGRYRPLAQGDQADDTVRAMLSGTPPGRGLSGARHWGLAQVLWAPQGCMPLEALSGDADDALRRMIGGQVTDVSAGPLEQRIEAAYKTIYTPGGVLKKGCALLATEKRLEAAQAQLAEAREQYLKFEEQSRRVEDAQVASQHARNLAAEAEQNLRATQERLGAWRQLDAERRLCLAEAEAASAQYLARKQKHELLTDLTRELSTCTSTVASLEEGAPGRLREREARQQAAAKALAHLEDTRRGREAVDLAEQEAREATLFQTTRAECTRLEAQLLNLAAAEAALGAAQAERKRLAPPSAKELRQLREALRQRDEALLQLRAASVEVEWVPETDGEALVLEGEEQGPVLLRASVPVVFRGIPRVAVALPGQGRLRASGPETDVAALRQAQQQAEDLVAAMTSKFGSADPDVLAQRMESAAALDQAVAQATTRRDTLLGDEADVAILQQTFEQAQARKAELLSRHAAWVDTPPDVAAAEIAAQRVRAAFLTTVTAAENDWQRTEAARASALQEFESHTRALAEARAQLARVTRQREEAEQNQSDAEGRAKAVSEAALAWEAAQARLLAVEARMPPEGTRLESDCARLEASHRGLAQAAEQERDKEQRALALLEQLAGQGTYSKLAALEEEVASIAADAARERKQAEAIRRLRDTVEACRTSLRLQVYQPVEARATAILERIAGHKLGPIALGESFAPTAVQPRHAGAPVGLDALSGGEQEQLYLAVRLALARELSKEERQLVVLDDVLTATDSARLRRIHSLLEEAAAQLQVVVLTCHPELYRGMQATWFDLEALQQGPQG